MDKINHTTKDILGGNIEKIAQLFPSVVTEAQDEATGELKKVVDFDLLRQHLSDTLVEGDRERFRLDWPGKKASILKANTPISKTLRPVREDSVDFDTTGNVFIEGDNFDVLKVLQESYLGKIKMIYIDPPYNTGKDFIYRDNRHEDKQEHEERLEVFDTENGGRLVKNTETNGRYHSDWLSMMQERLIVARDLLTDDGVIFISIDENEQANLKTLCDEVFGENNYLGDFIRKTKSQTNDSKSGINYQHEFILSYARQISEITLSGGKKDTSNYTNPDNDPNGPWIVDNPSARSGGPNAQFEIKNPHTGTIDMPPRGRYWAFAKDTFDKWVESGKVQFKDSVRDGERGFFVKKYKKDLKSDVRLIDSLFGVDNSYMNQTATKLLNEMFSDYDMPFDYPKPLALLLTLVDSASSDGDIVLDFFSGSGTTAHAVMQLNAKDGGNRKHIQVQLAEPTDEKSEAYKAGYKSIPEISRERIRRAGKKIREDYAEQIAKRDTPLDTGFRAYKLSSSNFINTAQHPNETTQASLLETANNIKEDRTAEDLLTETILDLGLTLDLPIEVRNVAGHTVYFVSENSLAACFDDNVTLDIAEPLAAEKPLRVVFKDSSFASDEVRVNIDIRLKQLSPETEIKVL